MDNILNELKKYQNSKLKKLLEASNIPAPQPVTKQTAAVQNYKRATQTASGVNQASTNVKTLDSLPGVFEDMLRKLGLSKTVTKDQILNTVRTTLNLMYPDKQTQQQSTQQQPAQQQPIQQQSTQQRTSK